LNDLLSYQDEQLKRLLSHAYHHVPYYRGAMQVFHINPNDIQKRENIHLMPFLDKETVRKRSADFLTTKSMQPALYKCYTSGSTGTPLTLYRDLRNIGFEYAMLSRQRRWAGLQESERYATLKGELFSKRLLQQQRYWRLNVAENKLVMSSYHISGDTVKRYIEALQVYHPVAIDGYPSSIYTLARLMLRHGTKLPMKAVLTSSETLVPEQKSLIEEAFDCRVFDYYGMAERVAAIHTCEQGQYHVVPEYSIVEFVRKSGLKDNYYEIVGTSLNNDAMPLIRYRMGDIVELSNATCECGRSYPVVASLAGRTDDCIITPGGKIVGRLDHILKGARNLLQAQIYQPEHNRIVLRIVPDHSFCSRDGERVLEKLSRRVGDGIHFEIQMVHAIPRSARGKVKSVVSNVV
jgi:phenylacetate-CoA ligase